jgi:hypothetical protein
MFSLIITSFITFAGTTDWPQGCLHAQAIPCAVRVSAAEKIEFKGSQFHAEPETTMVFEPESIVNLVKGRVFVDTNEKIKMKNFGYSFEIAGQVLVNRVGPQRIFIKNLKGYVRAFDGASAEELLVGFENWYVHSKSVPNKGIFKSVSTEDSLKDLNKLIKGTKDFKQELFAEYVKEWKQSSELSTQFYKDVLMVIDENKQKRKIAQANKSALENQQRAELRQLFRKKNYLE